MKLDLLDSPFDGRSLIEASAGTGKTWTLTALYARLLLERQLSVGQILVVTYTTAATAELRERIRARLADLLAVYDGTPSDDDFLNRLHARYPDEASRRRLLLAVHGFDEAAIFTIHGFCQRALQDAAFEAGGDFDSELTADDREIIDALLADAWRSELADADPAGFLTFEQEADAVMSRAKTHRAQLIVRSALVVLHDRRQGEHVLDRVVELGRGVVIDGDSSGSQAQLEPAVVAR